MYQGKGGSAVTAAPRGGAVDGLGGGSPFASGAIAWNSSRWPMPMIRYRENSKALHLRELHNWAEPAAAEIPSRDVNSRIEDENGVFQRVRNDLDQL
jgi:hypothetical protein